MASRSQGPGVKGRRGQRRAVTPGTGEAGRGRRRPRSGYPVIGPGLILALLASAFILWSQRKETAPAPRSPASTPAGNSALSNIPLPAPAPDLAFALQQRSALRLSGQQVRQLQQLEQQFEQETAEARAELDQASQAFAREMRERAGKGVPLPELQEQTAVVGQLSRQLAAARRLYWARAVRILTPAQRGQAEALWVRQLLGVRKRASAFSPAGDASSDRPQPGEHSGLPVTLPGTRLRVGAR